MSKAARPSSTAAPATHPAPQPAALRRDVAGTHAIAAERVVAHLLREADTFRAEAFA